jgi:hypothetical protein
VDVGGTFIMNGGTVNGNTASYGGGVYIFGTFAMSGGMVSGNTASSYGGGVFVGDHGTFIMSGGAVRGNILLGTKGYGREVLLESNQFGTFKISGEAQPERIFFEISSNRASPFITISGPLSGGVIPIDLDTATYWPLADWVNKPILKLDTSYSSGDLASLKDHFTLGNSKVKESPYTETAITGYKISDGGIFVAE